MPRRAMAAHLESQRRHRAPTPSCGRPESERGTATSRPAAPMPPRLGGPPDLTRGQQTRWHGTSGRRRAGSIATTTWGARSHPKRRKLTCSTDAASARLASRPHARTADQMDTSGTGGRQTCWQHCHHHMWAAVPPQAKKEPRASLEPGATILPNTCRPTRVGDIFFVVVSFL